MAAAVHRFADHDDIERMLAQGESIRRIATTLRCCRTRVRRIARGQQFADKLVSDGRLQEAPDEAEETLSVSSLALAPSVAELAIIVRENALAAYAAEVRSPYARKP